MEKELSRTERVSVTLLNILLILLPLSLLILFLLSLAPRRMTDTSLQYTLRFYPVREEYAGNVQVGDSVLDAVGKCVIGEVTAVERTPAMTESYDRTAGRVRRVPYPGYEAVTVTVSARAQTVQGGYRIGPYLLYRGKKMHVRLPHLTASGFCTEITKD